MTDDFSVCLGILGVGCRNLLIDTIKIMAQRFPGPGPSPGPGGPPPQRYQQPQNPGMRQYNQQNFPVGIRRILIYILP